MFQLDGLEGENVYDAVQISLGKMIQSQAIKVIPSGDTNWEIKELVQSGCISDTIFVRGGRTLPNPFGEREMNSVIFEFDRRFELWAYHVSHQQLLLRSNKRYKGDTRIEVLFRGVSRLCLPAFMPVLSIIEDGPENFIIDYGESRGFVEAVLIFHDEADLDYDHESRLLQRTIL